jgi:hypothetical protein
MFEPVSSKHPLLSPDSAIYLGLLEVQRARVQRRSLPQKKDTDSLWEFHQSTSFGGNLPLTFFAYRNKRCPMKPSNINEHQRFPIFQMALSP